jgi:hypothetical protein
MLFTPVRRAAGNFLKSRGYKISRPTDLEKSHMRSPWAYVMSRDPSRFAAVYSKNRELLTSVPNWISAETLSHSLWRYGVPVGWDLSHFGDIESSGLPDVDPEITSADLLAFIGGMLPDLRYLEIGVSVGKTFLQMSNQFPTATIVGLDVEELNPTLFSHFPQRTITWSGNAPYEVETLSGRLAKKTPTMMQLSNSIYYLSADQFLDSTWQQLQGRAFNLVFSDGVHSPRALRAELDFLLKYNLIDPSQFVMFWDDLWGVDMQMAFLENTEILCKKFGVGQEAISLFIMHGSYGNQRPMGLFCSFDRTQTSAIKAL